MATANRGDVEIFDFFTQNVGRGVHNLHASTELKLGFLDNTVPTISEGMSDPTWTYFKPYEIDAPRANYNVDGMQLTGVDYTLDPAPENRYSELRADQIIIGQAIGGFTNAYWGILYDNAAASKQAIAYVQFVDTGNNPLNNTTGAVTITFGQGDVPPDATLIFKLNIPVV
jgi:hypothetical protein